MNARTIALIAAVAIMGIGAIMIVGDLFSPAESPALTQVAHASQQIEPYTMITQDMIEIGEPIRQRDAAEVAAYPFDAAIGLMTTDQVKPGDTISAANAKPIEEVRYVRDLGLEIVSFTAGVDRTVGGKLRPGHIINLYGYGRDEEGNNFTKLIEPQLWVVAVSAAGQSVSDATPEVNPETGVYDPGTGRERTASMITVAVEPERAFNLINALGAESLSAWVTLSADQQALGALATPVPVEPTPTYGLPVDLSLTATALWNQLQATQPPPPPRTGDRGTP
ncbi:MAG: SAF domain-containing protein [Anaerolineae bacterium]